MKKILFILAFIGLIGAYTLHQRSEHQVAAPVSANLTPGSVPVGVAYKNGTYTGPSTDAYYGNVQVQVTIAGGKISNVTFLDYPHDRNTSRAINSQAMPYLQQEAIAAQSANVNIVSGATDTSQAFQQSLSAALSQAQA